MDGSKKRDRRINIALVYIDNIATIYPAQQREAGFTINRHNARNGVDLIVLH
jgi:hypothetical protein